MRAVKIPAKDLRVLWSTDGGSFCVQEHCAKERMEENTVHQDVGLGQKTSILPHPCRATSCARWPPKFTFPCSFDCAGPDRPGKWQDLSLNAWQWRPENGKGLDTGGIVAEKPRKVHAVFSALWPLVATSVGQTSSKGPRNRLAVFPILRPQDCLCAGTLYVQPLTSTTAVQSMAIRDQRQPDNRLGRSRCARRPRTGNGR